MTSQNPGSSLTIVINGGSPFGFRLGQGADNCLIVDKLRKNGKADEAGLKEGDVLLSVNGRSCQRLNCPEALSLIDHSGQTLKLAITRQVCENLASTDDQHHLHTTPLSKNRDSAQDKSDHVTLFKEWPSEPPLQQTSITTTTQKQTHQFSTTSSSSSNSGGASSKVSAPPFQTSSSTSRVVTVTAPTGVQVERNSDESFTMTIGFPFSAPVTTLPDADRNQTSASSTSVVNAKKVSASGNQVAPLPWQAKPSVEEPKHQRPPPVINPAVSRLLPDLIDSDVPSSPDTPGAGRKKLFIDSAFYDDPEHKYPTLVEQVQLARQVAMSVLAPANTNSKGHKMFMRAKERAVKYTTGPKEDQDTDSSTDPFSPTDEDPWKMQNSDLKSPTERGPYGMPTSVMFAPKLPTERTDEKLNALSSEELERLRLSERKTTHTNVSPQLCFNLAEDLRNMKGKGGKLFAKRQAKSESWDESGCTPTPDQDEEESEAKPEMLEKLKAGHKRDAAVALKEENVTTGAVPVNRLAGMVNLPKAAMTPWEAAAQYGNVEKAFAHLEKLEVQKRSKNVMENLEQSLQRKARPHSTIVPRSSGGDVSPAGNEGLTILQIQDEKVKAIGGNADAAGLARIMTSSLNKTASGFRQMKFKAPATTAATAATGTSVASSAASNESADVTSSSNQIDRPRASQMSVRLLQA